MTSSVRHPRRLAVFGALAAIALMALIGAAQTRAATTVYPGGGSGFDGGPEGWEKVGEPTCTIPIVGVCSASAGYDGATGNPPGSLVLETNVLVNALGLLTSDAALESSNFVATQGGAGTISLERAVANSGLLDLTPTVDYEVTLLDRTSGKSSVVVSGTATGSDVPFAGISGSVSLVEGHTYALRLAVDTSSQILALGLLGGTTVSFDNIAVTVGSTGGLGDRDGGGGAGGGGAATGGGGGDGARGGGLATLTSAQLRQLIGNGLVGSARLKGNRIFVKAKCPKRIRRACRVTVQGFLRKGKAATTKRNVRIGKGKAKRVVLRVKPKLKSKVRKRKRLLFKQTVRARGAKATVFKRVKLIRR